MGNGSSRYIILSYGYFKWDGFFGVYELFSLWGKEVVCEVVIDYSFIVVIIVSEYRL